MLPLFLAIFFFCFFLFSTPGPVQLRKRRQSNIFQRTKTPFFSANEAPPSSFEARPVFTFFPIDTLLFREKRALPRCEEGRALFPPCFQVLLSLLLYFTRSGHKCSFEGRTSDYRRMRFFPRILTFSPSFFDFGSSSLSSIFFFDKRSSPQ